MRRLPKIVEAHLEKARAAALSAVENYNKPGVAFRTRTYTTLMVIAWTALFHAIFYRKGRRPWYVKSGTGRGIRYEKVEGEPKHWELAECVLQYWGGDHPPERKNLEFMLRLRHKIEHRDHPELDPALYGECQAMLMNFEDLLVDEFGRDLALAEHLGVALQFSTLRPRQQEEAIRRLERSAARDVIEFVETFRAGLPPEVLASSQYSLKVFLLPKAANRVSAADLAVEFVPYDPLKPREMEELRKVTAIIKEKQIPVVSKDLLKPGEVVEQLKECLPYLAAHKEKRGKFMHLHTCAWRHYKVRPKGGAEHPERTRPEFCVYDELAGSYGYTKAWVKYLCRKLRDPDEYRKLTGLEPPLEDE